MCKCVWVCSSAPTHSGCGNERSPQLHYSSTFPLSVAPSLPVLFQSTFWQQTLLCSSLTWLPWSQWSCGFFACCSLELPFILSERDMTNSRGVFFRCSSTAGGELRWRASPLRAAPIQPTKTDLHPADSRNQADCSFKGFLDKTRQPPGNHSFSMRGGRGRRSTRELAIWQTKQRAGSTPAHPSAQPQLNYMYSEPCDSVTWRLSGCQLDWPTKWVFCQLRVWKTEETLIMVCVFTELN